MDLAPVFAAKRYLAERERTRALRPEPVYQLLLLGPDVTMGELLQALRGSGLVVSTSQEDRQPIIHRQPTDAA